MQLDHVRAYLLPSESVKASHPGGSGPCSSWPLKTYWMEPEDAADMPLDEEDSVVRKQGGDGLAPAGVGSQPRAVTAAVDG